MVMGVVSACSILKSPDVKNTEELIEAIGEVTKHSKDTINAAENEFNALTEQQQAKVENYEYFLTAKEQFAIINTENLINEIGRLSINSQDAIKVAENAYNDLTEQQKDQIENYGVLENAKAYLLAKIIYDDINEAVILLNDSTSTYQDAWHYGIWGGDDDETTVEGLADEVGIDNDELDIAIRELEIEEYGRDLLNEVYEDSFSLGLHIVDQVFKDRGTYEEIENILSTSRSNLKLLEEEYSDYEYRKNLVDYWSKANSYYTFASDVTGNYNTYTDTVSDYKNSLETLKTDLTFMFGD
jgi:hypothetical protein